MRESFSDNPRDIPVIQKVLCGTVVAVHFGPNKTIVLVYDPPRTVQLTPEGYGAECIGVFEP